MEAVLPAITRRDLRLNVSAAIPAVLRGVGFPVGALRDASLMARTAGLIWPLSAWWARPMSTS